MPEVNVNGKEPYFCGCDSPGGTIAPCTPCEWGELCPQKEKDTASEDKK